MPAKDIQELSLGGDQPDVFVTKAAGEWIAYF
jgi:hypothetical protein